MTELETKSQANSIYPVAARETDNPLDVGTPVRGWLLYYCISRTILGPLAPDTLSRAPRAETIRAFAESRKRG
jgi:hypothetical protein